MSTETQPYNWFTDTKSTLPQFAVEMASGHTWRGHAEDARAAADAAILDGAADIRERRGFTTAEMRSMLTPVMVRDDKGQAVLMRDML